MTSTWILCHRCFDISWTHFKTFSDQNGSTLDEASKFLLINNLNAAPIDFNDNLVSGVKTSAHNSDISLELNFRLPPVSVICDSFLLADGLITLKPGGDLTLSY